MKLYLWVMLALFSGSAVSNYYKDGIKELSQSKILQSPMMETIVEVLGFGFTLFMILWTLYLLGFYGM